VLYCRKKLKSKVVFPIARGQNPTHSATWPLTNAHNTKIKQKIETEKQTEKNMVTLQTDRDQCEEAVFPVACHVRVLCQNE